MLAQVMTSPSALDAGCHRSNLSRYHSCWIMESAGKHNKKKETKTPPRFQKKLKSVVPAELNYVSLSQRSLHNAPIFRHLLKAAVNGSHQCDFPNFRGT